MSNNYIKSLLCIAIIALILGVLVGCKGSGSQRESDIVTTVSDQIESVTSESKQNSKETETTLYTKASDETTTEDDADVPGTEESVIESNSEEIFDPDETPDYVDDYVIDYQEDESVIIN